MDSEFNNFINFLIYFLINTFNTIHNSPQTTDT